MLTANLLKGLLQCPCLQGSGCTQRKGLFDAHKGSRIELYFWKGSTVCQKKGWTDEKNSYDVVLRLLSALTKKSTITDWKRGTSKNKLYFTNTKKSEVSPGQICTDKYKTFPGCLVTVMKENVQEGRQSCWVFSFFRKVYTFPYKSQVKIPQPQNLCHQTRGIKGMGGKGGCTF